MNSSPYFWLQYIQSKARGRFRKILWPSQNIWTLPYTICTNITDNAGLLFFLTFSQQKIMPVSALIIFALFVQIAASKFCEVENDSMEFGYFSCYPRLNKFNQTEGPFQAFPLTVCILQCENSPFRYIQYTCLIFNCDLRRIIFSYTAL